MKKKIKENNNFCLIIFIIIAASLSIYCLSMISLFAWGFLTSLKGKLEYRINLFGLPKEWLWSNYKIVLKAFYIMVESGGGYRQIYVLEMFFNSILYAVGCALIQALTQYVVAYAIARFDFKFNKVVYNIVIVTMILPIVGSLPSEIQMATNLGLIDHYYGLWIMKANFLGMYFLVFYAALKNLPKDYSDAAYVDGASQLTVMTKIIFPLVKTVYLSIALLLFIGYWNDYQTPMVYMPNLPTVAYGLYYFSDLCTINEVKSIPVRLAGCMMMCVPVLILFIFLQNQLMNNMTIGGLKE